MGGGGGGGGGGYLPLTSPWPNLRAGQPRGKWAKNICMAKML